MGIFNFFKKEKIKDEKKKFTPQLIKTDNVQETLSKISQNYNIPLSNLDFDLINFETYVKLNSETDFVIMDDETKKLIKEKNLLLNEDFEIKQSYEIKVKKFNFRDDFELIGKVEADRLLSRVDYVVSPSSLLIYSDLLEKILINELYKKKLKSRMLIHFTPFEEDFLKDIQELVTKIRVLGAINEDFYISLCKALPPINPTPLKVIEHYKKYEKEDSLIKELIYPITKGDLIIEIIKPKQGKNGRNCRGEFIKVKKLKDMEIPLFKHKDDVLKIEDDNTIRYRANKNGYVYIEGDFISIKDELEVRQISLKTGNVRGAENSDVRLEVNESNALKEAIKDGMVVETTDLYVKGNVGNNAKIKAKKLKIDGQTHRYSKIAAIEAEINVHKGLLKGKKVLIHRLEGGKIEADTVHILQAISGQVVAREIKVDLMGSHITLISSDLIEIQNLKGSDNKFIIDESKVAHKSEYVIHQEEKIKKLEIEFRKYKDKFQSNKALILKNKSSIKELKVQINLHKKENIPINPLWIKKVKQYNDFVKKTKEIENRLKMIKDDIKIIKEELDRLQNGVFTAKIKSFSGFPEFNRIEFKLIEPPLTITYDTKKSDKNVTTFVLRDLGETYKIVGIKE